MASTVSPMGDGESSQGGMLPYKRSQRPSWSCTECARRKIKCDKRVPCQSCVKRGRADQCRLEGAASMTSTESIDHSAVPSTNGFMTRKHDPLDFSELNGTHRTAASSSSPTASFRRGDAAAEVGSDSTTSALLRLQKQLDRIERRLSKIDDQAETVGVLDARITDVEDVIHVLGENRSKWQETSTSPAKADYEASSSHAADLQHRQRFARDSNNQSDWADLDAVAGHNIDSRRMMSSASATAPKEAESPSKATNVELESRDAATTLEFLTLGKDRRQGLALNDTGSDSEQDIKIKQTSPHRTGSLNLNGPIAPSDSATLLKYLRRELPAEVLNRIESVLHQHAELLPPSNLLARPTARPVTDCMKAVRLAPASIRGIVYIAKEIGAWQHCCVHFPTFEREVEAFLTIALGDSASPADADFEGWRAIDPAWLALFFVICGIAIHQMSPEEGMQCDLNGESYRTRLASDLLNAAMDSLSLADYLVKPSIYSCQTIAILCVAGHNICGSDLLTSLLAIGIKTGQTLNLHALGKTAGFLETCANQRSQALTRTDSRSGTCRLPDETAKQFAVWKKRIIDLEVGKRVWWAFTQQDYFAIPFSGCFSIVEGQYDTPLPHNCSDEDLEEGRLINRKVEELTVASKQRFTCHVAKIVCDFFEDLNKIKDTPRFSLVLHHEQRLRFVTDRFRACLRSGDGSDSILPSFSTVLQHYLFISVNHKILVMHRAFLSRKVSSEERELSHSSSIETARGVLHELERGLGLNSDGGDGPQLDLQSRVHGGALWTIPYHSVAAATILALDIFRAPRHGQQQDHRALRRKEVKRALDALGRLTKKSAIARRGCQLLSDLLEEGRRFDERLGLQGKRKASDEVDSVMKRIRLPEADEQIDRSSALRDGGVSSPNHRRTESGWLDKFSKDSARSDMASTVTADGRTPDDNAASSPFRLTSFGYGSSHFNPLAGNSTSRAPQHGTAFPIGTSESLSSMFLSSSDASVVPPDLFSLSHSHAPPHQTSPSQIQNLANTTHPSQHWLNGSNHLGWNGNVPSGVDINMPQQHLAHILPALESMPDVWKLFDGTLGQSLVAFEESGF